MAIKYTSHRYIALWYTARTSEQPNQLQQVHSRLVHTYVHINIVNDAEKYELI
jgi:hypothetical protein